MVQIEKVEKPNKKRILDFVRDHPEEVFSSKELEERLDIDVASKTGIRYHCQRLVTEGELEKIKYSQEFLFGVPEAIEKLKEKLGY